jgi:hypothetical protein
MILYIILHMAAGVPVQRGEAVGEGGRAYNTLYVVYNIYDIVYNVMAAGVPVQRGEAGGEGGRPYII